MIPNKLLQTVKLMDPSLNTVGYIYTTEGSDVDPNFPDWKRTWIELLDNKGYWKTGGLQSVCGIIGPVTQVPTIAILSKIPVIKSFLSNGYTIALV